MEFDFCRCLPHIRFHTRRAETPRTQHRISLHIGHMGWLRLVGPLKLHVYFAEFRLFSRALLQKRPIILRSLLIVATSYHILHLQHPPALHCNRSMGNVGRLVLQYCITMYCIIRECFNMWCMCVLCVCV